MEWLATIFFGFWLMATILYTFFNEKLSYYTNRWDIFKFISNYRLFTGTPATYQLFYRDILCDGTEENTWTEVPLIAPYKWYHMFCFPESLKYNNIEFLVSEIDILNEHKKNIRNTFYYRHLVNFILHLEKDKTFRARQFKIIKHQGAYNTKNQFVYASEFNEK